MCKKTKEGFAEGIGNPWFWLPDIKEQERNIEECEMNKKMKNELISWHNSMPKDNGAKLVKVRKNK